jgi:predicted nucleic acid-binding protein
VRLEIQAAPRLSRNQPRSAIIISWLRGCEPVSSEVIRLLDDGESLLWTPVSVEEIFAGVRKSEEERVEGLFLVLDLLALSAEIGRKAGLYLNAYGRSHAVELGDALIAASAVVHRLQLWTLNRKHYPMKDIRFFSPAEKGHRE